RHGLPGFTTLLEAVDDAWRDRREELLTQAGRLAAALARSGELPGAGEGTGLGVEVLDRAAAQLTVQFDGRFGGFGGAPKFPQAMSLDHLLRHHVRTGSTRSLDIVLATLDAMAAGGMYDQLGGGFHRYSVDAQWLVPHFEKMLYDNALLARVYLDAWQLTRNPAFRRVVEETLAFVRREMTSPEGGFYSSLDADSEGEEGRFYVWTPQELEAALGVDDAGTIGSAFDVTAEGNFEARSILHPVAPGAGEMLDAARDRLMAFRARRVRPHRDEKVIAGWNGLMLPAFAEAGRVLDRPDLVA